MALSLATPRALPPSGGYKFPQQMDAAGECLLYYDEEKRHKGGGIVEKSALLQENQPIQPA